MQLIQERNYLSLFLSRKSEESIVSKGYVLISGVTAHTLIAVIFNYRYLRGWHAILKYFSPLSAHSGITRRCKLPRAGPRLYLLYLPSILPVIFSGSRAGDQETLQRNTEMELAATTTT